MGYTKGEWKVSSADNHIFIEGYGAIADCYGNEANAHLIATAPDLYEACKEVISASKYMQIEAEHLQEAQSLNKMIKAVAKVEGG